MARYLGSKCKVCRRLGESVCGSAKCALLRRNTPPGMHGTKGRPRLTGYGIQLHEKQKAKATYGVLERQFRTYYEKAKAKRGKTGEYMLVTLERRFDNVIYRAGLASTRRQARQLVSHGQFIVNGKNVNIPSFQINKGDSITVKTNKAKNTYWSEVSKNTSSSQEIPAWISVDRKKCEIKIQELPTTELIQSTINMNLIIELYSL